MDEHSRNQNTIMCPKCGNDRCHRSRRQGIENFLKKFGFAPYRCARCKRRFLARKRNISHKEQGSESAE